MSGTRDQSPRILKVGHKIQDLEFLLYMERKTQDTGYCKWDLGLL